MNVNKQLHKCEIETQQTTQGGYGIAIDACWQDEQGRFWAGNGEYANTVKYCPFCGTQAPTYPVAIIENIPDQNIPLKNWQVAAILPSAGDMIENDPIVQDSDVKDKSNPTMVATNRCNPSISSIAKQLQKIGLIE